MQGIDIIISLYPLNITYFYLGQSKALFNERRKSSFKTTFNFPRHPFKREKYVLLGDVFLT